MGREKKVQNVQELSIYPERYQDVQVNISTAGSTSHGELVQLAMKWPEKIQAESPGSLIWSDEQ